MAILSLLITGFIVGSVFAVMSVKHLSFIEAIKNSIIYATYFIIILFISIFSIFVMRGLYG